MANKRLTAHIPIEAAPENLIPLLEKLHFEEIEFSTVKALLAFTKDAGLGSRTELHSFASSGGLLHRNTSGVIGLTGNGRAIAQAKPEVRTDLTHFLFYTGWDEESPRNHLDLWGYRMVVDAFWEHVTVDVLTVTNVLTEEIRNNAFELFGEDISFSDKSVRGVRKWLELLTPPSIENNTFSRRHFCHPELLLMMIGRVAQKTEGEIGIDFLLTPERRDTICRGCVLEPAAFDRVLDWVLPVYPDLIQPGTTAGVYGRFVRLLKWPVLSDLMIRNL